LDSEKDSVGEDISERIGAVGEKEAAGEGEREKRAENRAEQSGWSGDSTERQRLDVWMTGD